MVQSLLKLRFQSLSWEKKNIYHNSTILLGKQAEALEQLSRQNELILNSVRGTVLRLTGKDHIRQPSGSEIA